MVSPIRQKILTKAAKGSKSKRVTLKDSEDNDFEVEVRSPSLGESLKFSVDGDNEAKFRGMLKAIIACTFDPSTNERVFDAADENELLNQPQSVQGIITPLVSAIGELMAEAQETAKN
jgi:siroheme synthase (precorrin-2 oxidase/ferrochelatase)